MSDAWSSAPGAGGLVVFHVFFSPLKTLTQRTRLEFGYETKKCPFFLVVFVGKRLVKTMKTRETSSISV